MSMRCAGVGSNGNSTDCALPANPQMMQRCRGGQGLDAIELGAMSIADTQRVTAGDGPELSPMVPNIDVDELIDRLQGFALYDPPGTMTDAQVDAAIALLDRVLPDLHYIELCAADGQPILVRPASAVSADDCPITKIATK